MCKFLTAILAVIPLSAAAQQFPNRPIRFVMAYPPGGSESLGTVQDPARRSID